MRELWADYHYMLAGYRRRAALVALLIGIAGSLEGVALLTLSPLLTPTSDGKVSPRAPFALGAFVALAFLSALGKLASDLALMRLRSQVDETLRQKMTAALMRTRYSDYLGLKLGDISRAIFLESLNVGAGVQHFLSAIGASLVALLFFGVALFLSPLLTLLTIGFAGLIMLIYRLMGRKASRQTQRLSDVSTVINEMTIETFGNLKFFRAAGLAPQTEARMRDAYRTFREALYGSQIYGYISRFFFESGSAVFVGSFLAFALLITHQPVATALMFLAIFLRLTPRISAIQDNLYQARFYRAWCATWRERYQFAREREDHAIGTIPPRFEATLQAENLWFTYPNTERQILTDVSWTLSKGDCLAFVGESGSGKSTLVDMVTGLLTPDTGRLTLDDVPFGELDLDDWRGHIGLVMQDSPVLHASILENIAWGDPRPNRDKARECAELAHIWPYIAELPQGLDTVVGEKGGRMSGGQRQRIALARALYRDPWLLVLDEATSALDGESERHIQAALERLKGRFAILLVAHRLKTVKMADEILVLSEGRIVERGTWEALLARPESLFGRMTALQNLGPDTTNSESDALLLPHENNGVLTDIAPDTLSISRDNPLREPQAVVPSR